MQASQQLNSTRSFSSKLLKLNFCDPLSKQHRIMYQVLTEVGKGESNL